MYGTHTFRKISNCLRESRSLHSGYVARAIELRLDLLDTLTPSNFPNYQRGDFIPRPDSHYDLRLYMHESFFFPSNIFATMNSTSRQAKPYMYRQPFAHTNSFLYSFSAWNALPSYVANMTTPSTFKNAYSIVL